jgi:hypothetical protein
MNGLQVATVAMAAVMAAGSILAAFAPRSFIQGVLAFPRNRVAAWTLTAVDLVWVAALLLDTNLGRFEAYKPLTYVLAPVFFFLITFFMGELLAARALGGLFLLVPAPILDAARWHDSPWRLVMVVLAYALVVKGIALVLSPYLFRRGMQVWVRDPRLCRLLGSGGLLLAALLIVLAGTVYRLE